jgi:hypothetical protein
MIRRKSIRTGLWCSSHIRHTLRRYAGGTSRLDRTGRRSRKRTEGLIVAAQSKFTQARRDAALEVFRAGGGVRQAARAAQVDHATMIRWLARAAKAPPGGRWSQFGHDVEVARAGSPILVALRTERERMMANPDLAWRFIERTEPGYSRVRNAHTVPSEPVQVEVSFSPVTAGAEKGDPA